MCQKKADGAANLEGRYLVANVVCFFKFETKPMQFHDVVSSS